MNWKSWRRGRTRPTTHGDSPTCEARSPCSGVPAAAVLGYALWDIHSLVYQHCMDFLFLHAGAVAGGGRRVILPAAPETGKSTLVASLLRLGCEYLSDELAPIDPVTAGVYPFPKHIAVARSGLEYITGGPPELPDDYPALTAKLSNRYLRPGDLKTVVAGSGSVDMIVFPTDDREGTPTLQALSSARKRSRASSNTRSTRSCTGTGP